jgi:hypothetical protein
VLKKREEKKEGQKHMYIHPMWTKREEEDKNIPDGT